MIITSTSCLNVGEKEVLLEGQVCILQKSWGDRSSQTVVWQKSDIKLNNNLDQYRILIPIAFIAIKFISKQEQNKNC